MSSRTPMRKGWPRSLAVRVVGLSSVWAVAAFLVVGGLISGLYERTAVSGFEGVMRAQLYNLINAVTVGEDDLLSGSPDLGDLAYARPLSGWYWEVIPASDNTFGRLASSSLGAGAIPTVPTADEPFDAQFRRSYLAPGLGGEEVRVEEVEVVLDAQNHAARFRVMGNWTTVERDIADFNRRLALYLGLFGLGSILINALAILYGLKPLGTVRRALGRVRTGEAERLDGEFPAELEPLALEMNALIDNNRRVVERARTQVGNLAHSLKTPIAVLTNEAGAIGGDKGRLVSEQAQTMRVQVQHYLDRARVAAQNESPLARTPVAPSVERLAKVTRRLNPDLDLETPPSDDLKRLVFAGEREDLEEMLGNLLENAAKWARSGLAIRASALGIDRLALAVNDDGPGLSPEQMSEATRRGRRFDEAKPGSGLGLSIVSDTVAQYRGEFRLSRSDLGGLRAELILPRAASGPMS